MGAAELDQEKVRQVIAKVLKVPLADVRMEARFRDDLGSDSLDLILLLYEMEDQLAIRLSDDEAKQIQTVGDAVRLALQVSAQK